MATAPTRSPTWRTGQSQAQKQEHEIHLHHKTLEQIFSNVLDILRIPLAKPFGSL